MAVTHDSFVTDARFRTFSTLGPDKTEPMIAVARKLYDAAICGDLYDDIVAYETAKLLWVGPTGAPASKNRLPVVNPYEAPLQALIMRVRPGPVVA